MLGGTEQDAQHKQVPVFNLQQQNKNKELPLLKCKHIVQSYGTQVLIFH